VNQTRSAPLIRIIENVDRAAHQPRSINHSWQPRTIRCFITVGLAAILVTAALVGTMIAIAKNTKGGLKLDSSSMNGNSTFTDSHSGPKMTSRSTDSASIPWSTAIATSEDFTTVDSAMSTTYGLTASSQRLQIDISSIGSSVRSTTSELVQSSTTTAEKSPPSIGSTSTLEQIVSTDTLESLVMVPPESALTGPASYSELLQTTAAQSDVLTTSASSDEITTNQSTTDDTTTDSLPSATFFESRTPVLGRPNQGGQRSSTQRVHGPAAHEWVGGQRASQGPDHHGYQGQNKRRGVRGSSIVEER
jgi:hypothetical protein